MTTNKFTLKFSKKDFELLRHDPAIKRDLKRRADAIQARASGNGSVDGYMVTELRREVPRGAVSVMATGHARNHNRKHHALLRSLDAGKR